MTSWAQKIEKNIYRDHKQYYPAVGIWAGGIPNAIELQLSSERFMGIQNREVPFQKYLTYSLYFGKEGRRIANTSPYENMEMVKGGSRIGFRAMFPFYTLKKPSLQFYGGLGLEVGKHKIIDQGTTLKSKFRPGITMPLGLDYYVYHFTLNKKQAFYLTVFAEITPYKEFGVNYFRLQPTYGARLNLFRKSP